MIRAAAAYAGPPIETPPDADILAPRAAPIAR